MHLHLLDCQRSRNLKAWTNHKPCFLSKVFSFFIHSNVLQFSKTGSWMLPTAPMTPFPAPSCSCSKGAYLLLELFKNFISLHLLLQLNPLSFCWYMSTIFLPIWKCLFYLESPRRNFNSWPFGHVCDSRSILILFP